jgi:copper chaperone CopZ
MRNFIISAILILVLSGESYADTIKASVNGLVCAFCATGIEKTFTKQPAVQKIKVDLQNKLVTIDTKPAQTLDDNTITKLINDAGYSVTDIKREQ